MATTQFEYFSQSSTEVIIITIKNRAVLDGIRSLHLEKCALQLGDYYEFSM